MKVAIYTRISRDGEGGGLGVERQAKDCEAYCAKRGWNDITVFTDNNITGMGTKHRPDYEAMLARVKAGEFGAIVTWHLDRMTRSPKDLEHLIDLIGDESQIKVEVQSLNGGVVDLATPEGRLNVRIMANISRYYVEHNRTNNKRARQQYRNDGEWHGGKTGYGWKLTGKRSIAPVESEAVYVRKCFEMFLAGHNYADIARYMNDHGQTTRTGSAWSRHGITHLLRSATHAGLIEYMGPVVAEHGYVNTMFEGELYEANWEGIVSRDTWMEVRSRITDPTFSKLGVTRYRSRYGSRYTADRLLTGIMTCGACGRTMCFSNTIKNASNPSERATPRYVCQCGGVSINFDKADDYVVSRVLAILRESRSAKKLSRKTAELARIDAKLAETAEAYRADEITRTQLASISRELRNERGKVENAIKVIGLPSGIGSQKWWDELPMADKRNTVKGTVRVTLVRSAGASRAAEKRVVIEPV